MMKNTTTLQHYNTIEENTKKGSEEIGHDTYSSSDCTNDDYKGFAFFQGDMV